MGNFYLSICLSAFLLFLVEPLIGKTLLPWFGGSAAVWSTAMLFFQVLLTAGYAYAAWLSKTKRRGIVHVILLGASLILMLLLGLLWRSPITPPASSAWVGSPFPILGIFLLLAISIGLPFFLLASNSTFVQAAFERLYPAVTPYRLYAYSNFSSLLALLCYPFLIEPNFSLPIQGWGWSVAFGLFAGYTIFLTIKWKSRSALALSTLQEETPRPTRKEVGMWLALSSCTTILLLSITNYLTQQVAVIPFLWVLPLAIYLLTFALAFSGERWYPRQILTFALIPIILLYDLALANGGRLGIPLQVIIFSLLLFLGGWVCNGELYRLRPAKGRLPAFYLTISIGGAMGGILVNLVAPLLFKGFWELPLGVLFFCVLFLAVGRGPKREGLQSEIIRRLSLGFLAIAILISLVRTVYFIGADLTSSVLTRRNFYGVLHVVPVTDSAGAVSSYQLVNDSTIHGEQFLGPGQKTIPTVYYGPESGVGLVLNNYPRGQTSLSVGALGLGVGTIAVYGKPVDSYHFYEINPLDIRLAEGQGGYFSFLSESEAKVEIVEGDARLSMERENAAGHAVKYDVLVLDVFTNDAIPVHLLDEQAFDLFLSRLEPAGILAVHITNAYLDLVPVVSSLADHFSLAKSLIVDSGDGKYTDPSTWMLLSRQPSSLAIPEIALRASPLPPAPTSFPLWTDDYTNLFQILKH